MPFGGVIWARAKRPRAVCRRTSPLRLLSKRLTFRPSQAGDEHIADSESVCSHRTDELKSRPGDELCSRRNEGAFNPIKTSRFEVWSPSIHGDSHRRMSRSHPSRVTIWRVHAAISGIEFDVVLSGTWIDSSILLEKRNFIRSCAGRPSKSRALAFACIPAESSASP